MRQEDVLRDSQLLLTDCRHLRCYHNTVEDSQRHRQHLIKKISRLQRRLARSGISVRVLPEPLTPEQYAELTRQAFEPAVGGSLPNGWSNLNMGEHS